MEASLQSWSIQSGSLGHCTKHLTSRSTSQPRLFQTPATYSRPLSPAIISCQYPNPNARSPLGAQSSLDAQSPLGAPWPPTPYRYSGPTPPPGDAGDVRMPLHRTGGDNGGQTRTVEEFMTWHVACLTREMPIKEAIKILIDKKISGAPVVEPYQDGDGEAVGHGRLVGVLSEEDLMWKEAAVTEKDVAAVYNTPFYYSYLVQLPGAMESFEEQAAKMLSRTVGESMNADPIAVGPDCPIGEAAGIMLDLGVSRLPVVARRGEGLEGTTVVGIVTRKDILKHVATLL